MKQIIIAFTLLATIGLCTPAFAKATPSVSEVSFQWAGTVPPITRSGSGYFIVPEKEISFQPDTMRFEIDAFQKTKGTFNNPFTIGFKVVRDEVADENWGYDETTDIHPLTYQAKLINLKVRINGQLFEQADNGDFEIRVNGVVLGLPTETVSSMQSTIITMTHNADPTAKDLFKNIKTENMKIYAMYAISDVTI